MRIPTIRKPRLSIRRKKRIFSESTSAPIGVQYIYFLNHYVQKETTYNLSYFQPIIQPTTL